MDIDIDKEIDLTLERDFIKNSNTITDLRNSVGLKEVLGSIINESIERNEKLEIIEKIAELGDKERVKSLLNEIYKDENDDERECMVDYMMSDLFKQRTNFCVRCGDKILPGINKGMYDICTKCEKQLNEEY